MAGTDVRTESLADLHTALVDSRNGYEEALDDAEGRGLSALFREMIALRDRDAEGLARVLASLGREPDRDGSFMSTVHRTIMKVRSLFDGLDQSVLPGLIDGEERILGYYDEAVEEASGRPHLDILEQQRRRLRQTLDRMRAMQASGSDA